MIRTVLLVRHPPVARAWQTRCYGQSDPGLSRDGARQAKEIARRVTALAPDLVIHSDLRRTHVLAELIAATGIPTAAEPLWRERHFGDWEGRSWNAIYRETGNAMEAMLTEPDSFRPGGGETTMELMDRVRRLWQIFPLSQRTVIITHGGPIACATALEKNLPINLLATLVPSPGEMVRFDFTASPTA